MSTTTAAANGTRVTQPTGRGRLPAPRRDKRPALAALALLLVLLGALGSALVAFRSGSRVDVLVARTDIAVGSVIEREDLTTARVAADGVALIPASAAQGYYGRYAASRIPAGTLLTDPMLHAGDPVPDGAELVGLIVDPTRRTTAVPQPGDVVRPYVVTGDGSGGVGSGLGQAVVEAAQVVDVGEAGSGGVLSVTLLVRAEDAGTVATYAAGQQLAITTLPPGTEPPVAMRLGPGTG